MAGRLGLAILRAVAQDADQLLNLPDEGDEGAGGHGPAARQSARRGEPAVPHHVNRRRYGPRQDSRARQVQRADVVVEAGDGVSEGVGDEGSGPEKGALGVVLGGDLRFDGPDADLEASLVCLGGQRRGRSGAGRDLL